MKKLTIFFLFFLGISLFSKTAVVNLGMVFNYHPLVLMYYYPEYNAFMRPIDGKITIEKINMAKNIRDKKKKQLKASIDKLKKKLKLENKKLIEQKKVLINRMNKIRNLYLENLRKMLIGKKQSEIKTITLREQKNLNKKLKPYKKEVKKLEDRIKKIENEEKELDKKLFYVDFTTPKETEKFLNKIQEDMKTAIKKVALNKNIDLVLNSSIWERSIVKPENISYNFVKSNFMRVKTLSGNVEKRVLGQDDLVKFASSFYVKRNFYENIPMEIKDFNKFIVSEYADISISVIAEIFKLYDNINYKVKKGILAYLKSIYKK